MPSNKKKSKVAKDAPSVPKGVAPALQSYDQASPKEHPLNVPRWTMLIMLAVGASKLLEVRNASTSASDEFPSAACVNFLGEDACKDSVVTDLLKYKYQSGLSVLLLVLAAALECLSSDRTLQLLQGALAVCLMLPAGAAFYHASDLWIPSKVVRQQLMVLAGFSLVAIPSKGSIPFVAKASVPPEKTLQSLAMISLACLNLFTCSQIVWPLLAKGDIVSALKSLTTQASPVDAVTPILYFFGVDKFASAGVYAFSWYYFTNEQQRSFFFFHGLLRLIECFYQFPSVADIASNVAQQQQLSMTIAVASFVCWKAPDFFAKEKSGVV